MFIFLKIFHKGFLNLKIAIKKKKKIYEGGKKTKQTIAF